MHPLDDVPLAVDRSATTPLAVQIADRLRSAATNGLLRTGDRLPSSRALADRLGVSRTVVTAAYEQLHAEGWITGRHGAGTYIDAAPRPAPPCGPATAAGLPVTDLIDLAPGAPCVEVLDRAAWRRAWRSGADGVPLIRKDRAGEPAFRDVVAEHLLRHRGLTGTGRQVLATAGTSSATAELVSALLRPGDTVAAEDPGYGRAVGAMRATGIRVVAAPLDDGGMRVDELPTQIRAVYCTPAHQFPLGARMSAPRRVQLVEQARARGAFVIEDDYDGELRYDTAPLPLLATLGPDVVVHLGTTSKILTPALGVGWMVAPEHITAAVLDYRERTGTGPSPAGQRVVAELARRGDLARHLRRLRRELAERRALVIDALQPCGRQIVGDAAGSHVVVVLESHAAEERVVAAGRSEGIYLDGLARHHLGAPRVHGIVLGYTACTRAQLIEALPVVAGVLVTVAT